MNLLALDQRYPLATTTTGALSGLASWILSHSIEITNVAGMIGAIGSAALTIAAILTKLIGWIRARREESAAEHFVMRRHEPFEDHLP